MSYRLNQFNLYRLDKTLPVNSQRSACLHIILSFSTLAKGTICQPSVSLMRSFMVTLSPPACQIIPPPRGIPGKNYRPRSAYSLLLPAALEQLPALPCARRFRHKIHFCMSIHSQTLPIPLSSPFSKLQFPLLCQNVSTSDEICNAHEYVFLSLYYYSSN